MNLTVPLDKMNRSSSTFVLQNVSKLADKFEWPEYVVFALVLLASSAIGIFYGCFGSKQKTVEEYLMASKQMSSVPVALSLICSFVSAITILGTPAEVYFYSSQMLLTVFSFIPITLCLGFLYVPVFFHLRLNSVYEYFLLRFNSRELQVLVSVISLFNMIIYMSVCVHAPALGLSQVIGIDDKLSTAAVFLVCIFYSSLGGLKAVLWTDTLQAVIMFGSLIAVVWKGVVDVGGLDVVWSRASMAGRIQFLNFDFDPRTRHTFWTAIVGGYFYWLPAFVYTQAQMQRFLSMPTMSRVWRALLVNMIGFVFIISILFLSGIVIFGKYFDCDPVTSGALKSSDQLLPLFVMETLGDYPGLPGVFVGGITCASLSSISSCLNAIASVVVYDYVKVWKPDMKDENLSRLSKILTLLAGLSSFGLVYVAEHMGNVVPVGGMLVGMMGAPITAIFTLGMFFPWANAKGCLVGLISGILLLVLFVIGTVIASAKKLLPNQRLPTSTAGCYKNMTDNMYTNISYEDSSFMHYSVSQETNTVSWKERDDSILIQILSISYVWVPAMGFVITCLLALFFSILFTNFQDKSKRKVEAKYLSKPVLSLWINIFSDNFISKWVDHST